MTGLSFEDAILSVVSRNKKKQSFSIVHDINMQKQLPDVFSKTINLNK